MSTAVTATYEAAPVIAVEDLAPQSVRGGEVLGFSVPVGTTISVVSGTPIGFLSVDANGWFNYQPDEEDRMPFEVSFVNGSETRTITITPNQDLPDEEKVIACSHVPPICLTKRDSTTIRFTSQKVLRPV